MPDHGITNHERRALILLFALLIIAALVLYCTRRSDEPVTDVTPVAVPAVTVVPADADTSVTRSAPGRGRKKPRRKPAEKKPVPVRDPRGDVVN